MKIKHTSINQMLSKADEKTMLQEIITSCPDGYVHDILQGVAVEIENAIDSDFGFITLSERFAEITEHRKAIEALKLEQAQLKTKIRELTEDARRLENGINELRTTARRFAQI